MNAAAPALNLAQIYKSPVFSSRSAVESHSELSRAIVNHSLRWGRGEVTTSLYKRHLERISLMILSYGAEVEVTPDVFEDFILVQMPLLGASEIEVEGRSVQVAQGEIAVIAPFQRVRLLWQQGCKQLILKIPGDLVHGTWGKSGVEGDSMPWVDPLFKLDAKLAVHWHALLRQLLALLPTHDASSLHPAWLGQFERTAASFLLTHQPSARRSERPGVDGDSGEVPANASENARLDQLERYIRSRLFAPISLADLARAAGISPRSLNALCHQHRGVAPMVLLRNLRLEAARDRLATSPISVTEAAMAHGFGHLGRFSAYYRERFGELPRQTGRLS